MKTKILSKALGQIAGVLALAAAANAWAFDLVDTAGQHHKLADYRGKYVILNFWATWCVPCLEEIPEIADFRKSHPDVVVLGVAIDSEDDVAKAKRFAAKTGHTYPLVIGDDAVEKQLGRQKALPTTRIYDPAGKVVYDKTGRVDRKKLEELTRREPVSKT